MPDRIAIIDLGTNTFHLLIVEYRNGDEYHTVFKEKQYVKLAEGGIKNIHPIPYQRGINALLRFREVLDEHDVDMMYALGTAALRTAQNGEQFMQDAYQQAGIDIQTISGDLEAELIYHGVKQSVPLTDEFSLIMDIGGGSVEFIVANWEGVHWKKSYPLGAAVLSGRFHKYDPITQLEIDNLKAYLNKSLQSLAEGLIAFPIRTLIGASGTFDTLTDMILAKEGKQRNETDRSRKIPFVEFYKIYQSILGLSYDERLKLKGMVPQRADMIVVALVLIDFVLEQLNITELVQSNFAMKQGIAWCAANEMEVLDTIA